MGSPRDDEVCMASRAARRSRYSRCRRTCGTHQEAHELPRGKAVCALPGLHQFHPRSPRGRAICGAHLVRELCDWADTTGRIMSVSFLPGAVTEQNRKRA